MSQQSNALSYFFSTSKSTSSLDTATAPTDDSSVSTRSSTWSSRSSAMSARGSIASSRSRQESTLRRTSVSQNKLEALFGFSDTAQPAPPPPQTPFHSLEPLREKPDFGHHEETVNNLRYTIWDLVALTAEDESFKALKQSLRRNGAVTNEMLKQGLPLFIHRNRSVILQKYFKELDRQQEQAEQELAATTTAEILRQQQPNNPATPPRNSAAAGGGMNLDFVFAAFGK